MWKICKMKYVRLCWKKSKMANRKMERKTVRGHLLSDWHLIRYYVGEVVGKQVGQLVQLYEEQGSNSCQYWKHTLPSTSRNLSFGDFHSVWNDMRTRIRLTCVIRKASHKPQIHEKPEGRNSGMAMWRNSGKPLESPRCSTWSHPQEWLSQGEEAQRPSKFTPFHVKKTIGHRPRGVCALDILRRRH